jgi:peptidoglycan hydrolase-like protein with peptidoglycan-binding domain
MSYSLIWLPSVLYDAGLKIAEVPGWQERGKGDMNDVYGVICHHTAGKPIGNMPTLDLLVKGRTDLTGPLSQLGLGRDGTFYIIAAGRCNHAGTGIWKGLVNGNSNFIGIEAENTGLPNDFPWPVVQMQAYYRGVAAILKHIRRSEEYCVAHREYALPYGRKPDANFDMQQFRMEVARILRDPGHAPPLIPSTEPVGGGKGRLTLRRGSTDISVKTLQELLGIKADGNFGPKTEAALRAWQRSQKIVPDGICGPKTWSALDNFSKRSIPRP